MEWYDIKTQEEAGGELGCAICEDGRTYAEKRARLRSLAESVVDPYEGFALCLSVIAKSEGFVDEVIEFMEANPAARSDEILDFLDSLIVARETKAAACGKEL